MILIDNPESEQLDSRYTFTDNESNYQLRYSFFKQTVTDFKDVRMAFMVWTTVVLYNAAGYETESAVNFNDSDVKDEFNGDFGCTKFVVDPRSDFGEGYKFIMINFYYKENQGIVVQSILFNDLDFVQNPNFDNIFHSFKFHK